MEEKKNNAAASGGQKKGTGNWKKIVIICLALVLAAAAYGWYTYNLPAKRLERALKKADALMEEHNYEAASSAYEKSQDINGVSPQALQGQILAELYRTDEMAAKASDIPSRAQVCDQYAQIMQLCDDAMAAVQDTSDERFTQPRTDAEQKRTSLQKGIAAEYEKVDCVVETEDRSGSVRLPDGSDIPYTQYFDLAKVQDEYYPYSEIIDAALKQDMDEYFADPANDISAAVKTVGAAAKDAVYRDYVGVEGFYSGFRQFAEKRLLRYDLPSLGRCTGLSSGNSGNDGHRSSPHCQAKDLVFCRAAGLHRYSEGRRGRLCGKNRSCGL